MMKFWRHFVFRLSDMCKSYIYGTPSIDSVARIWNQSTHSAFTDLILYRDRFFLCFRESDDHAESQDGKIRVLMSPNGKEWTSVALLEVQGWDLRDPMLSIMPDGKLMLTIGGLVYKNKKRFKMSPCVAFSPDGTNWSTVNILQMPWEWIWRLTWHDGVGYGAAYSFSDPKDLHQPWNLKLFKTTDGLTYTFVTDLDVPSHPSETTFRFLHDGTMIALTRRRGMGWIGSSSAPYTKWDWNEIGYRLGGPNFLVLPDGKMWACSRRVDEIGDDELKLSVVLAKMGMKDYQPVLTLPSGGDCGYPGMVYKDSKLYVSYYSSHEGKAGIYFAVIEL